MSVSRVTGKLELNKQFLKAFELVENSDKNVFTTGRAGTGKSTFLNYLREGTSKQIVIIAPTAVAALDVKGQTSDDTFVFLLWM